VKLLVARADFEKATNILSDFINEYIVKRSDSAKDLHGDMDTRENFSNELRTDKEIKYVLIGGHGDYEIVTGQNYEILWASYKIDELRAEAKGKDIFTISCRCGKGLGKYLMKYGAVRYKGYKESFVLLYGGKEPYHTDDYAQLFLMPAITRGKYMVDEKITPDEAEEMANKLSDDEIETWKKINPQVADLIAYDKNIQVYYKSYNSSWWEKIIEWIREILNKWLGW
jgi:hypothetical protein